MLEERYNSITCLESGGWEADALPPLASIVACVTGRASTVCLRLAAFPFAYQT